MTAILALRSESASVTATTFLFASGTAILGRSSKCDLTVKHETISRRHAELAVMDQAISVRDLGSCNGTFIDNERIVNAILREGQFAKFGSVVFRAILVFPEDPDPGSEIETVKCSIADAPNHGANGDLSGAQRRVLAFLLEGLAEKNVASRLKISRTTVHNHIQAIYRIFNVHSRAELLIRMLAKPE